jgi:hypothetical protein
MTHTGSGGVRFTHFDLGIRLEMNDNIHALAAFIPTSLSYEIVKTLPAPLDLMKKRESLDPA